MAYRLSPPPIDSKLVHGDDPAPHAAKSGPIGVTFTSISGPLSMLPEDPVEREDIPLCTGVIDYFIAALIEVAKCSKIGNEQHNLGQEMHWARGKSTDHSNKILRHLADRGRKDKDGIRHSAKVAWRALALLQTEMEAEGAPMSRASR